MKLRKHSGFLERDRKSNQKEKLPSGEQGHPSEECGELRWELPRLWQQEHSRGFGTLEFQTDLSFVPGNVVHAWIRHMAAVKHHGLVWYLQRGTAAAPGAELLCGMSLLVPAWKAEGKARLRNAVIVAMVCPKNIRDGMGNSCNHK